MGNGKTSYNKKNLDKLKVKKVGEDQGKKLK
jgi:hypothetical protein